MLRLLQDFLDIALWRKGPQDLPASPALLVITAICYAALSFVQVRLLGYPVGSTALLVVIDLGMTCGWLIGVLTLFGFKSRFTQTLTAMLGVGILLASLDIAILGVAVLLGAPKLTAAFAWPQFFVLLLVVGRILMMALERGLLTGMALAFAIALSTIVMASVFVPPLAPAQ